jgi:hypothetical protein
VQHYGHLNGIGGGTADAAITFENYKKWEIQLNPGEAKYLVKFGTGQAVYTRELHIPNKQLWFS